MYEDRVNSVIRRNKVEIDIDQSIHIHTQTRARAYKHYTEAYTNREQEKRTNEHCLEFVDSLAGIGESIAARVKHLHVHTRA